MFGSSRYLGAPLRGVAITLVALAGGALGAASASADNQTVQVTDFAFAPAAVAVKPGETVTWNFAGGTEAHNVTFEDGSLRYPPGEDHDLHPWSTSKTFAAPAAGMYRYFCDHHGSFGGVGMAGVVYVNAGGELPGTAPTATFSVSTPLAIVGEPVTFSAAGSNDPDPMGSIIRYEWDLDNDGRYDLPDAPPSVSWTFAAPGERTVNLRVTDKDHRTKVATRTVMVTSRPTAAFSIAPGNPQPGQTVTFDAAASSDPDPGGSIARYEWDLDGNGSFETDTGATPSASRSYGSATTLAVALRVTDNLGATATTTSPLTVSAPPPPPPPAAPVTPPAAPPPPPAAPTADDTAPRLSALAIRPSSFRAGTRVTVRYRLSEDATTTFTVHRIDKGRRKGSSCQRPSSSNRRGASCSRYVRIRGSLRDAGEAGGRNSVRFTGALSGRKLRPGRYRLTAVSRDVAGNVGTARTATFVIRRR